MVGQVATTSDRAHMRAGPEDVIRESTYAVKAGVFRRISWGAIIAGTAVALGCQLVFTTLGAGIGLAAIEPAAGDDPGTGFAIGAGLWWLITGLISLFVGGMVAGRLSGFTHPTEAFLHGVLVWSVTGILGVMFITTSAATLIGGALGPIAQGFGQEAGARAANGDPNIVDRTGAGLAVVGEEAVRQIDQTATGPNTQGDPGATPGYRPLQPADPNAPPATRAGDRTGQPRMTEAEAREAADKAADVLASAAVWSFFALLLGALAAGFGGMMARPPLVEVERATVG